MTLTELEASLAVARRAGDYSGCFAIIDKFMSTATGHELGEAMRRKAGLIALFDSTQIPSGLSLIDRALDLLAQPGRKLLAVVNGLALCRSIGDTVRADQYAHVGYFLLRNHGDDPEVKTHRSGLYISLGRFSEYAGDLVQAYWHYNQAIIALQQHSSPLFDSTQTLFWAYTHTANVCLKMDRAVEALEAVESASRYVYDEATKLRWETIHRAALDITNPPEWTREAAGNGDVLGELTQKS